MIELFRLTVVPNPDATSEKGRASQSSFLFFRPDGTPYLDRLLSTSELTLAKSCYRKWGFKYIDGIKTTSPALEYGNKVHGQLEGWLKHGNPPQDKCLTDSGVLTLFPLPHTPGLISEGVFAFVLDGVGFWGFKDVASGNVVWDLKTTGDLANAKSEDQLKRDEQANIYALDAMLSSGTESATCKWCYTATKGKPKSVLVSATITKEEAVNYLAGLINSSDRRVSRLDLARTLSDWRTEYKPVKEQNSSKLLGIIFEPNQFSCFEYKRPCDFKAHCNDLGKFGMALSQRRQEEFDNSIKEKKKMSGLLDRVKREASAAGKAPELQKALESAPQIPVHQNVASGASTTPAPPITPPKSVASMLSRKTGVAAAATAVSTPVVSTPVVSTPVVSTPVVSTPAVSTPAVSTPAVSTPAVTTSVAQQAYKQGPLPTAIMTPSGMVAASLMQRASDDMWEAHFGGVMRFAPEPASAVAALGEALKLPKEQQGPTEIPRTESEVTISGVLFKLVSDPAKSNYEVWDLAGTSMVAQGFNKDAVIATVAGMLSSVQSPPAQEPPKVVPGVSADPPKKRGRPPKAVVQETPASAVPAPATETVTRLCPNMVLYVDCFVCRGGDRASDVEGLIAPAREQVELDIGADYRTLDFGKGKGFVAAQLLSDLKESPASGRYMVSSRTCDKEVLEVLVRVAGEVIQGC